MVATAVHKMLEEASADYYKTAVERRIHRDCTKPSIKDRDE